MKKNWRFLCGLYVFIYLPWFFYLENTITMNHPNIHIINNAIDNMIPFCKYFIIPYYIWFFYVVLACIFMVFTASDSEFIRFAISLIAGMSISLLICMIYPSGLTLRPATVPDDFFGTLIGSIYASDTPTNVCPSIHVYNSLAVHLALHRSPWMRRHKIAEGTSFIICILICMSTVFIKQHSLTDVFCAIFLMCTMYLVVYAVDYGKLFKKNKHEEMEIS